MALVAKSHALKDDSSQFDIPGSLMRRNSFIRQINNFIKSPLRGITNYLYGIY